MSPHALDNNIKTLVLSVKNNMMTKEKAIRKLNLYKDNGFEVSNKDLHDLLVKKIDHALEIMNRF